jgi:hypothetical protein
MAIGRMIFQTFFFFSSVIFGSLFDFIQSYYTGRWTNIAGQFGPFRLGLDGHPGDRAEALPCDRRSRPPGAQEPLQIKKPDEQSLAGGENRGRNAVERG